MGCAQSTSIRVDAATNAFGEPLRPPHGVVPGSASTKAISALQPTTTAPAAAEVVAHQAVTPTLEIVSDHGLIERKKNNSARGTLAEIPLLADLTKAADLTEVDGHVLSMLVVAGFAKLDEKKAELNKMNVFPIPDSDTGANMVICTKNPARNMLLEPTTSIMAAAGNLAADVLLCGQGNSGTILSHFFITLAEQIQAVGKESCSINEFAQVIARVGRLMNKVVPTPVEGTMISTARDGCVAMAADEAGPFPHLLSLLEMWSAKLNEEVLKTPEQLVVDGKKPLEGMRNPFFPEKNNVDSGAQGFVYFVDGMLQAAQGELSLSDPDIFQVKKMDSGNDAVLVMDEHNTLDSKFQYCTEAVILLKDGQDKETVLTAITAAASEKDLGDSIACVGAPAKGGGNMVKVHIHANEPEQVFDTLRPFSKDPILAKEKVEDMFKERDEAHGGADNPMHQPLPQHATFSVVGVGMFTPPKEQVAVHRLPVYIIPASTEEPVDVRYSTDNDTIAMLNSARHNPERIMTAAPTPVQVKLELVSQLEADATKRVLLLSVNKVMSAADRNICEAVESLTPEQKARVSVYNHGFFLEDGVVVREALRACRDGNTIEEAVTRCDHVARRAFFSGIVSKQTFKNLAVSGRAPNLKLPDGPSGKLIMVHPQAGEIEIADGTLFCCGKCPPVPEVEANHGQKAMNYFTPAGGMIPPSEEGASVTMEKAMDNEIKRIQAGIGASFVMRDPLIMCMGRPDVGNRLAQKLRDSGIKMMEAPEVNMAGFFMASGFCWGEIMLQYWVEDKPS
eukprot:COSAG05_NODE_60_length_23142_cov_25.372130_13_plen_791_part_00